MVFGGKFRIRRSNSKASYLPRQSHEKLASDPDHGSYKLTLNSNEDCIHLPHNVFHDPIHATKINNLPDVLPLGVKMKNVSSRYNSNNNLNGNLKALNSSMTNGLNGSSKNEHHHQMVPTTTTSPSPTAYSLKSMFSFNNSNKNKNNIEHNNILTMSNNNINHMHMNSTTTTSSASAPISTNTNGYAHDAMTPTKYMSQSTIDLKKAQHLFGNETIFTTNHIHHNNHINSRMSATESMGNLIDCTNRQSAPPFLLQHNLVGRKSMIISENNHLPNNTNLSIGDHNSMNTNGLVMNGNIDDKINRTDSLKENINKITQLQTKLMSTHLNENLSQNLTGSVSESIHMLTDDSFNDSLSTDTSSVSQLSSESMVSNDINENIINTESQLLATLPNSNDAENQTECQLIDDAVIAMKKQIECMTSEVGSQTDETMLDSINTSNACNVSTATKTIIVTKTKYSDEYDCEKLTDALVQQLAPNDRLRDILAPKVYKSTGDYVTGLYNPQMASRCIKKDAGTSMHREQRLDLTENTPLNGSYYSINEPSQQQFIKQLNTSRYNREMTLINGDTCDLTKQKEELVIRLTKQLVALTNDRTTIADQNTTNDLLGTDISSIVSKKVRPSEATKFRSYIDDVGHITMLLLSLSGRLARTENSLFNITDAAEKKLLDGKRVRLLEQLDEAKRLKIDIDRRGKIIGKILEKYLTNNEYADYDYFINTKAKLIVDLREVTDRIQLHEEQLNALKETLVHSEC